MNKVKRLEALLLAAIMMLSLGVSASAKDDLLQNYDGLFSLIGHTDGAESEDLSYELYQAFEADPRGFINAAANLENDALASMASYLVYYAGYFEVDDFKKQVVSCDTENLTEAERAVVNKLLQEIDIQQGMTTIEEPEELPEVPKFNPIFLEKLVSAHVNSNNFEDEEFLETLSTVYIDDPMTFSAILAEVPAQELDLLISSVAAECVKQGKKIIQVDEGNLTEEQQSVISDIEEKIAIASKISKDADSAEMESVEGVTRSTQVPTIGTMTYQGNLICGEATTLKVTYSEATTTSISRTYWTEVYAVRDGKEHLKATKSITIPAGASSTTQSYSITYDNTGLVYTLVKVYTVKNGSLLTQRQGKYSDTVTGEWYINVTLPKNRLYKGTLALYHANGALQKTCECLGLAVSNGPMSEKNGNTPTGTYSAEVYDINNNSSYGPYNRIWIKGLTGIAKTSGRTELMIHGGTPEKDTTLARYPLRWTNGCIRVSDSNQQGLVQLINSLVNDFYADRVGKLTVKEN